MLSAKLIEYAYPTSTHATNEGYGKTGCWFIAMYKEVNSWDKVEVLKPHFTDKEQAFKYAESLPNPYHYAHKYFNQD